MTNANDTASAAQRYIERGWAVVQLHDVAGGFCSCGSADPHHADAQGGKHPIAKGWQNAGLRSSAAVADAWARRPGANIGIVTGRASGIWVLDVDPLHGGDKALAALVAAYGPLPETYTVRTGSGGRHYYWKMPDFDFTTSRGQLPVGLDVRGNAGQVVAPPSYTLRGTYSVLVDVAVAVAPAWLLGLIRPLERPEPVARMDAAAWLEPGAVAGRGSAYASVAVRELLGQLAAAQPGERNVTAYRVGRRLAELVASPWAALDGETVAAWYMDAAARCDVDGGFSQTEAMTVLTRAVRDQGGRGVDLPAPDHLGTRTDWVPPSDFDQAGQGPASGGGIFTSPGTSTHVAAPLINGPIEQQGEDAFLAAVMRKAYDLRVNDEARRYEDRREFARTWRKPITFGTLTDELALPIEELVWRVAGLLPADGNAVMVAPRKAGKTTLIGALIRSLVDGTPFLGRYHVEQVESVALFNYENTARQQRQWLRELNIVNTDRVHVLHLRGSALALNVPDVRRYVAGWLRERAVQVWMPDPYARAGQGVILNENDNGQANTFTGLLDEVKAEAGVREIIMPAHSSNKGEVESGSETSRGAGRLEDWADALWYLTVVEKQRYLRATGRDVELDETQLNYDQTTRSLTIGSPGRGRREVALERDAAAVAGVLREWADPTPATQNDLQARADLGSSRRVSAAVQWLVERNLCWTGAGARGAKYHYFGPKPTDVDNDS